MEWWVILPLAVWVWLQAQRIDALARRIAELEQRLAGEPVRAAEPSQAPVQAPPVEELLLTRVVSEQELLLDTPLPEASNDLVDAEEPASQTLIDSTPAQEPEIPAPAQARPVRRGFDRWLAENGLAWIAGGALALGAIFLVGFAAQQNWFTAPVRLACAVALGLVLLGASEWTRRIGIRKPPGHPLMSALLAGAGILAFYATTWAAHGIYGFVGWGGATALLALCAAALIALSTLHGQSLGVLAIGAALLAPAIAGGSAWPQFPLTLYLGAVSGGGFMLAATRRWAWIAAATAAGLYFWFFAAVAADQTGRALAMATFASLGALAIARRVPPAEETSARLSWANVRALGPSIAIAVSSALMIWTWLAIAPAPSAPMLAPALAGVLHVALAAYAVRARVAAPATLVIAIAAVVLGFTAYLRARGLFAPLGQDFYPAILFTGLAVVAAALSAQPHRSSRVLVAATGAVGAALLVALAAASRSDWHGPAAWMALSGGAALLLYAAYRSEAATHEASSDRSIGFWAGAGAALILLCIESAIPAVFRTTAHAAVALGFAAAMTSRGWRILGHASLAAAALSLGHALSPSLLGPPLRGEMPIAAVLSLIAASAAMLFAASRIMSRSEARKALDEALSSASVIAVLICAFLVLRWLAVGGAGAALTPLAETSLRTLALLAAGLTLAPRDGHEPGPIGAWRGHVLLGLGLFHALFMAGLVINPWWGVTPAGVLGAPLLNTLALAFAAPAALAATAARQSYTHHRTIARVYAVTSALLALFWMVTEIRRAFHAQAMSTADTGLFEASCYGLAFLVFALGAIAVSQFRLARDPDGAFTQDLTRATGIAVWAALGCAVLILLTDRHPLWGWHDAAASDARSTLLATLAQAVAAALALAIARALSQWPNANTVRFAAAAASAVFALSFGHCAIRWMHHRGFMDDGVPPLGLEGLGHALWPLMFVLGAAALTQIARHRAPARSYLLDLQAIWGIAIWPALAFTALGFWLSHNPWWGIEPARFYTGGGGAVALAGYALAAGLSAVSPLAPGARWPQRLSPAARALCAAHLFVAATLIVRWIYHNDEMTGARAGEVELWVYSAVWALFGAAALGFGSARNDPVLRWVGLAVLIATTIKVFVIDTARLSGVIRAASFLGLGAVLMLATWAARRNQPKPAPGDLITVKPSAPRERLRVRRRSAPHETEPKV
ncbi:MAG: DUF2339 domain-containing protein [Hyphomonadaceae bacterium]